MTTPSIGIQRALAARDIDVAAGLARRAHLTMADGQALVYAGKLAQAQAYIAAYAADSGAAVPGYVAADVAVQGGTALQAAQAIIDAADAFHAGPGPDIEQARRGGKLAVQSAETAEEVAAALAAALEALAAI